MEKIITVHGKKYKVTSDEHRGACQGCVVYNSEGYSCYDFTDENEGNCHDVIFQEITETPVQTKPQVQLHLELDLTQAILPVFFTVKGLKVQSLDTALKNQSDAYNISVKDLPQETIEVLAEELKQEFIKRNTKVAL